MTALWECVEDMALAHKQFSVFKSVQQK